MSFSTLPMVQGVTDFPELIHSTGNTDYMRDGHRPTPKPSRQPDSLPWEPARPQYKAYIFGNVLRHHCLLYSPDATSFFQDSSVPFLSARNGSFSIDAILSGYEDVVSSGTDHFTMWVKVDPHEVLVHHMVDVQKATADFREASERRPATCSETNCASKHFCARSPIQRRLSIYKGNPWPRRGKEDAFEKQIAGRWHVIPLQEASEYQVFRWETRHSLISTGSQPPAPFRGHDTANLHAFTCPQTNPKHQHFVMTASCVVNAAPEMEAAQNTNVKFGSQTCKEIEL